MGENDCILFSIESVGKADFLVITHLNMGQSQTRQRELELFHNIENICNSLCQVNGVTQLDVTKGRMKWNYASDFPHAAMISIRKMNDFSKLSFSFFYRDLQNLLRFAMKALN